MRGVGGTASENYHGKKASAKRLQRSNQTTFQTRSPCLNGVKKGGRKGKEGKKKNKLPMLRPKSGLTSTKKEKSENTGIEKHYTIGVALDKWARAIYRQNDDQTKKGRSNTWTGRIQFPERRRSHGKRKDGSIRYQKGRKEFGSGKLEP